MSETAQYFFSDIRVYVAIVIGSALALFSSRSVVATWPLRQRVGTEVATVAAAVLLLLLAFLFGPMAFDWSGEFSASILCAFGFALSVRLMTLRGWGYRGGGLALLLLFGYIIYSTMAAWVARAHNGNLFR